GTANILTGKLVNSNGVTRLLLPTGEQLAIDNSAIGAGSLILRPQNITLSEQVELSGLRGQISHREFLGAQVRYLVDVANTQIVVDQSHAVDQPILEVGATVGLVINSRSAVFLPEMRAADAA
ncbi:TOBE domain-containing protein, partial [uncultured Maritalea sp.]